jgi:hypothetical protein
MGEFKQIKNFGNVKNGNKFIGIEITEIRGQRYIALKKMFMTRDTSEMIPQAAILLYPDSAREVVELLQMAIDEFVPAGKKEENAPAKKLMDPTGGNF